MFVLKQPVPEESSNGVSVEQQDGFEPSQIQLKSNTSRNPLVNIVDTSPRNHVDECIPKLVEWACKALI